MNLVRLFLDPKVLEVVSRSTLGILALMSVGIGVIAVLFFKRAPVAIRVLIFVLILGGVVAFGTAVATHDGAAAESAVATHDDAAAESSSTAMPPKEWAPGPTLPD